MITDPFKHSRSVPYTAQYLESYFHVLVVVPVSGSGSGWHE